MNTELLKEEPSESEEILMRICFDLPRSLAPIAHLRKSVRCFVESIGLTPDDADDLEMMLGELSSNVVRHAGTATYHVSVDLLQSRFCVTVIDQGVGFPTEESLPGTLRPDTLPGRDAERIGGLGLVMIRGIADQVEILPNVPQGTTVRAQKALKEPVQVIPT
ncbi:MAG: ATP-binding protein [Armatimonadota bacterium]